MKIQKFWTQIIQLQKFNKKLFPIKNFFQILLIILNKTNNF
jgi:hypothetical protein